MPRVRANRNGGGRRGTHGHNSRRRPIADAQPQRVPRPQVSPQQRRARLEIIVEELHRLQDVISRGKDKNTRLFYKIHELLTRERDSRTAARRLFIKTIWGHMRLEISVAQAKALVRACDDPTIKAGAKESLAQWVQSVSRCFKALKTLRECFELLARRAQ